MHDWPLVHWDDGFRGRRFPTQGAVRPDGIVVAAPFFDDNPDLLENIEYLAVEQLISEPRLEALAVAILPRGARCDGAAESIWVTLERNVGCWHIAEVL